MEPSLPGDVMLLAVGDRASYRTRGSVSAVLAGALLCSEVQAGLPVFWSVRNEPLGRRRRRAVKRLVQHRSMAAVAAVSGPLCNAGMLAPFEYRVLSVRLRQGFTVLDVGAQGRAEQRLRAALTPGSRPDAASAALAVLCAVSGIARRIVPPPTRLGDRRAVAAHINGLQAVVGKEVAELLRATRDTYGRQSHGEDELVSWLGDVYGDLGGAGSGFDGGGDGGGGDGGGGGG